MEMDEFVARVMNGDDAKFRWHTCVQEPPDEPSERCPNVEHKCLQNDSRYGDEDFINWDPYDEDTIIIINYWEM